MTGDSVTLHHGDCIDAMRTLADSSVDAIVTDPPYGLGFMGREWDNLPPGLPWAQECLRVLKPGGHLLAFGGTRTWHRLACAVEDAGFEVRDSIAWLYGSGFPKSLDVSKAIDKAAGAEREIVGTKDGQPGYGARPRSMGMSPNASFRWGDKWYAAWEELPAAAKTHYQRAAVDHLNITAPATDNARTWQGWGTALKPAFEPIVVARKPLAGTVAGNVLAWGTGALNIDGCRVAHTGDADLAASLAKNPGRDDTVSSGVYGAGRPQQSVNTAGRWPANVVLDESQARELDQMSGDRPGFSGGGTRGAGFRAEYVGGERRETDLPARTFNDSGGASRFFYAAKAPKRERPVIEHADGTRTAHPTVKPIALMRWLVRLVTPPGGTVLEPFAGSGTTIEAALLEGFNVIGIEREAEYLPLIEQRIARCAAIEPDDDPDLFDLLDGGAA